MSTKFIDRVRKRRSVRRYRPDDVPRELIERCLEAVRHAPTACNTQSWKFVIVEGKLKERLVVEGLGGLVVPNRFAAEAPVIVVIAADLDFMAHRVGGKIKGIDYHLIDAGIAGEHFVLQAAELGLGTCWIGWFDQKAVKRTLSLPAGWAVCAMLTLGFPSEPPAEKKRKTLEEISEFRR
jgi:nitroreductase